MILYGMETQPNKGKAVWEGADDGEGVRLPEWEEALRRVREKDVAECRRKEKEAAEEKMEERKRLRVEHWLWERAQEKKRRDEAAARKKTAAENYRKSLALHRAKQERENRIMLDMVAAEARLVREERALEEENCMERSKESIIFAESVFQLARDLREKEEVEEEAKKKKARGEGAFSTQ